LNECNQKIIKTALMEILFEACLFYFTIIFV